MYVAWNSIDFCATLNPSRLGAPGHDIPGVHEFTSIVEKSQAAVNVLS